MSLYEVNNFLTFFSFLLQIDPQCAESVTLKAALEG